MEVRISVFSRAVGRRVAWTAVGVGRFGVSVVASSPSKARQRLIDALRKQVAECLPHELVPLETVRGRRLRTVTLDLSLRTESGRVRFHGAVPVVVEPRTRGDAVGGTIDVVYHPLRPAEWFVHESSRALVDEAKAYFGRVWAALNESQREALVVQKKDKLELVSFSVTPKTLESTLGAKKEDPPALLGGRGEPGGEALLSLLGSCVTMHVVDGTARPVLVRHPYRETLAQLACGRQKTSILLVGPSGVGKSSMLAQLVSDLLQSDDFAAHRNLDRAHKVWRIRGNRIIAGMSYLGQWEQRCVSIVEACRRHRGVLWIDDIAQWGRIGQSASSDRALATFFAGPVSRSDILMFAECTPEGYQQLQDDAPGFAAAFTPIFIAPTGREETIRMLVQEARRYEREAPVTFDPVVFRMLYDLGGSLAGSGAHPGKALDLLEQLATPELEGPIDLRDVDDALHRGRKIEAIKLLRGKTSCGLLEAKKAVEARQQRGHWSTLPRRSKGRATPPRSLADDDGATASPRPDVTPAEVIAHLASRTGMPGVLLDAARALDGEAVAGQLGAQIIGQERAVVTVRDLVLRIKAGLCDPGRPYGVLLFTGPTGTGKTEMAKCLADYLYGTAGRLVRFDMSEYGAPDAPARLIGDRFQPDGTLTAGVRAQPFSVVLLDEIEKADPSVLNLMLQLFDDGRLTDAAGRRVEFTHTVVIMTSNLGAKHSPSVGFGTEDVDVADVGAAVRAFFPPELFNRIDHVVQFDPLSHDAARKIAGRELDALVGRRGLLERNVFVRYTTRVVDRVVRDGFRAKDGARSLKRYLESNVGTLLADTLAAAEASAMRMLWLFEREDVLQLHLEELTEAEALGGSSPLEAAIGYSGKRLRQEVPQALSRAEALVSSPALVLLAATVAEELTRQDDSGALDSVADVDALQSEIRQLAEDLRTQLDYDPLLSEARNVEEQAQYEGELIEHQNFATEVVEENRWGVSTVRVLGRAHGPALPFVARQDFLRTLGTLRFLERAVHQGGDPSAHVVLLELTRVSAPLHGSRFGEPARGLFEWLLEAYRGARGTVDAIVLVDASGRRFARPDAIVSAPQRAVLRIVGPGAMAFYVSERGSHVRESVSGGTEVVRVRVLPGRGVDLQTHLDTLDDGVTTFSNALEAGAPLPDNPEALLPIVRRYTFDPPSPGSAAWVDVEDYPLMYAYRGRAASLRDALDTVWLLHMGASTVEPVGVTDRRES